MRKNKKICSLFVLAFVCVASINFVEYKIYGKTHDYYNTKGQEFIRNLNLSDKDNNYKKVPYSVNFIYNENRMSFKNDVL